MRPVSPRPEIDVILAPWDEFGRGARIAVDENGLGGQVKIDGVDVSTSDIQAIREPGSTWVATAAIGASDTDAAAVRAVALSLAGEMKDTTALLPPTLITPQFLNGNDDVKNEEGLNAELPAFELNGAATANWIKPAVTN